MYKRVLLKLSGEALADHNENLILGANNLNKVGETIKTISANGTQVCIVVGAGNIWRGLFYIQTAAHRCAAVCAIRDDRGGG